MLALALWLKVEDSKELWLEETAARDGEAVDEDSAKDELSIADVDGDADDS